MGKVDGLLPGQSSVNGQYLAGDESGGLAGQIQDGVGDVPRLPEPAEWNLFLDFLEDFFAQLQNWGDCN